MITSTGFAAHDVALSASTMESVQLAKDCDWIEVYVTAGSSPVYFTVDGNSATVKGGNTFGVPALSALQVKVPGDVGATLVKLISAAAATVTVTGS